MKKLNLDGYIVHADDKWLYDLFGVASFTQKDLRNFLKESDGEDIQLDIDCYGGDVWVASDMYSDLRAYKGKSTANVTGLSASASTIMMLGCSEVIASPTAMIMIHNSQSHAEGDYRDMEAAAERLKTANEAIINAYELKTSLPRAELQTLMDKATWMSAQDALKYKFIDSISLKEGEALTEAQITALMSMSSRVYAAAFIDPAKMHEMAAKMKAGEKTEEQKTDESGGGSGPVSDKQKKYFNGLRKKLIHD